jgi:hypothetical protein
MRYITASLLFYRFPYSRQTADTFLMEESEFDFESTEAGRLANITAHSPVDILG